MNSKTAFCILTNKMNDCQTNRFLTINKQLKCADFYILYDGTKDSVDPILSDSHINIVFINKDEMIEIGISDKDTDYRKNCDKFIAYFYYKHPEYDFYYLFENDIVYTGDYNELIKKYMNNKIHFLIENTCNYTNGKVYKNGFMELYDNYLGEGWHSIEGAFPNCISEMKINDKTATDYPYKILIQYYRCSKKFLSVYTKLLKEKHLKGAAEWSFASILLEYNFSYKLFDEKTYTYFEGDKNIFTQLYNVDITNTFIHHKLVTNNNLITNDDKSKFINLSDIKTYKYL